MAQSTLKIMQEIEAAAQAVLDDYERQKDAFKDSLSKDLEKIGQAYDQETQLQLADLEASSQKELVILRDELTETIAQNEQTVRRVLTDKKDELVQTIVDKVVERYGN